VTTHGANIVKNVKIPVNKFIFFIVIFSFS